MTLHSITRVCRATGISSRTLRLYEQFGLLSAQRRTDRGPRYYNGQDLRVLWHLEILRALQHPLPRTSTWPGHEPPPQLLDELQSRVAHQRRAGEQLEQHLRRLRTEPGTLHDHEVLDLIRTIRTWSSQ